MNKRNEEKRKEERRKNGRIRVKERKGVKERKNEWKKKVYLTVRLWRYSR